MSNYHSVIRRTFEAAKHPKGSPERELLNMDRRTSEYMTSYKFVTLDGMHFRLRRDAERYSKLPIKPICFGCGLILESGMHADNCHSKRTAVL